MGMTPGYGISYNGHKYMVPVNQYGEMEEEPNPYQVLSNLKSRDLGSRVSRGSIGNNIPALGDKSYQNTRKNLYKAVKMSEDSKRLRSQLKEATRKLELKGMKGEKPTENEIQAVWMLQDQIAELEKNVEAFYSKGDKIRDINLGMTPGRSNHALYDFKNQVV